MILSKFIKPKWQHRNPEVRKLALESVDDLVVLSEIAQNDEDATVRRVAVRRIEDMNLLYQIIQKDQDSGVREIAAQNFKQLLCGQKEGKNLDITLRLEWLNKMTDLEILEAVALHGQEVELRLAATKKIDREGLLGDISINDLSSEVRLTAVEKLTQKSTLERVFKATRNRDKRVSRIARDKLDILIEQQERPKLIRHECETICSRLESLGRNQLWEQEYAEFNRLQERWQTVVSEADSEFLLRFTKARQDFVATFERYQQTREAVRLREQMLRDAKEKLCLQINDLLSELHPLERIIGEQDKLVQQRLDTLQREWKNTPILEKTSEEQQWQIRFEELYKTTQERYKNLQTHHEVIHQLEEFCLQVEELLSRTQILTAEQLKDISTRWEAVPRPSYSVASIDHLVSRFNSTFMHLQNRLQEQKDQREQVAQRLKQLLIELESTLEHGELKKAIPLEQQIRELFKDASVLNNSRYKKFENRFQKCSSQISELRGWQQWGNQVEREKLCGQIENLVHQESEVSSETIVTVQELQEAWHKLGTGASSHQEFRERFNKSCNTLYQRYREYLCRQMENLKNHQNDDLEERARVIQKAQSTWKSLAHYGHTQELWEYFNKECNDAYEACRAYFTRQAQERTENLKKKEEICMRLEDFQIDFERPNWKEIYHFFREQEKEWRNVGTIERKSKKIIQKRYHKALHSIQVHLEEEQQHNVQARQQLIEKVKEVIQQLDQDNDIDGAITQVKHLQSQWQVTVPGTRKEERELWREFRRVCDMVFDRRKHQQEILKKELDAHLEKKLALCEQLEALAKLESEEIKHSLSQVKKLREEWEQIGTVPKKNGDAIERRFETACRQVEIQRQAFLAARQRRQQELLKDKASLCLKIERDYPHEIKETQITWEALPKLENAEWEMILAQRFERACNNVKTGQAETLKTRKTLCIRMEILAGINSPPEEVEARMAYQVTRLTEAMTGGEKPSFKDKTTEAQEIELHWYLGASVASEEIEALEQRFRRACEAFYAKKNN